MADPSLPVSIRLRAALARLVFLARLAWRIGGRAVALLQTRPKPLPRPNLLPRPNPLAHAVPAQTGPAQTGPAQAAADNQTADYDQIIEALQTGDTGFLTRLGPGFANGLDAQSGQAWIFNAVDLGTLASLHWFLAQGAALDQPDKAGRSLLQAAVERAAAVDEFDDTPEDPLPVIAALLDAGCAINAAACRGLTPLHVAAALGLIEVVQLLLARGADAALRDEGFARATPRDFAVQAGHDAVADLLHEV